jgi:hypothetical protein
VSQGLIGRNKLNLHTYNNNQEAGSYAQPKENVISNQITFIYLISKNILFGCGHQVKLSKNFSGSSFGFPHGASARS